MGEQVSRKYSLIYWSGPLLDMLHKWYNYAASGFWMFFSRKGGCGQLVGRWMFYFILFYFILFYSLLFLHENTQSVPLSSFASSPLSWTSFHPTTPAIRHKVLPSEAARSISMLCGSAVGQLCSVSFLHLACLSSRNGNTTSEDQVQTKLLLFLSVRGKSPR